MDIYLSDLLFTVLFALGLYALVTGQIKFEFQFGTSGAHQHVKDAWASKTILVKGKPAKYIGLAFVLISGLCVWKFKFGELLFTV